MRSIPRCSKNWIDAFAAYQADDSQLCAILTGSGDKAFAAGADIKEMSEKAGLPTSISTISSVAMDLRNREEDPQAMDRRGKRLRAGWRVRACHDG